MSKRYLLKCYIFNMTPIIIIDCNCPTILEIKVSILKAKFVISIDPFLGLVT